MSREVHDPTPELVGHIEKVYRLINRESTTQVDIHLENIKLLKSAKKLMTRKEDILRCNFSIKNLEAQL